MNNITKWVMYAGVAVWILWDIVVYVTGYTTISEYIIAYADSSITLPAAVGFLCGHWFWPAKRTSGSKWKTPVMVSYLILLLALDIWTDLRVHPIVMVCLNIPLGHYLWTQRWPK